MTYKVGMVSLGCPKNLVDSEVMLGLLTGGDGRRFSLTTDPAQADLLVVNTCGFIDKARKESTEAILDMIRYKQEGRCRALVVTGCLVQAHAKALQEEIPEIDGFLGSADYPDIRDVAEKLLKRKGSGHPVVKVSDPTSLYEGTAPRLLATPSYMAYLKISEGCDHVCGFCAIPALRGRMRSRSLESCLAEARALAARGVKELIVISQDTSEYGRDLYGKPQLLPLLKGLCEIPGLHWIRLQYLYPAFMDEPLLEFWASQPKLAKYVDMPLQHADDRILKLMKRPGSYAGNLKLLKRMRRQLPNASFRSSFIVGFPGEDDAAFKRLLEFIDEAGLDRAGFFAYSPEEGTASARLPGLLASRIRESRRKQALQFTAGLSRKRLAARQGQVIEVLCMGIPGKAPKGKTRQAPAYWAGRSEGDAPEIDGLVFFKPLGGAPPAGAFIRVLVEASDDHDFYGSQVL
jgi:ribosomal protein S12 methylthiotransferase